MSRDEKGHHLHHTLIGHTVTVRTPGDYAKTGLLVAVGEDRLVLSVDGVLTPMVRLITTGLEPHL